VSQLLLDTTFLIDAERSSAGLDDVIDDEDDVAIAAITIAELRVGALLAHGRRRSARAAYVDEIAAEIPILDYDAEVAEEHAELLAEVRNRGRPRGAHDLIIAATARAFHRAIVTADAAAFADLSDVSVRSHR
jgi:tRNA(fMet)-specific endonuclease VapC